MRQPLRPTGVACVVLALVAGLTFLGAAAQEAAGDPLSNEDVVRRFVGGTPEAQLVAWIRASRVAFDLSDEMRDELRQAGLPAGVLQAMIDTQAEQAAAELPAQGDGAATAQPEGDAPTSAPPGEPLLTVVLNASDSADAAPRAPLRVLDIVPPELAEQFGIRDPAARFTDIAIFLGCRTADHVPDQWRAATPLGRDFVGTPRHHLLQFAGGATRTPAGKLSRLSLPAGVAAPEILELAVPDSVTTPLEAEVAHDLTIGLALEAGGRWYLLVHDDRDGVVLSPDAPAPPLRVFVSTGPDPTTLALVARFE